MKSAEVRSQIMRAVKGADTSPEMAVHRLAHRMGYRFRLHRSDLPGKPDMVFPGRRKIILVHGCFWHGHECKRGNRIPKGNRDYLLKKIARSKAGDEATTVALTTLGWKVAVLWECEMKEQALIVNYLRRFLE